MSKKLEDEDWHVWWALIYHYVSLHTLSPERFPLHKNFWGKRKIFQKIETVAPFPEAILELGPSPRRMDMEEVIRFTSYADVNRWLLRRAGYVTKLIG